MSANFQIRVKSDNGDLFLMPKGDFDGNSAWELINMIEKKYDGRGQVVIDTRDLREMHPFGCSTFRCQFHQCRLPLSRLSFKGEKGRRIAPKGSKVLVGGQGHHCRCGNNCAGCPCSEKEKSD